MRFVQDIPLQPDDPSYALVSEVENRLPQLRHIPMQINWGDKDFIFDQHFLDRWTDLFPEAEVNQFPQAGHYLLEDAWKDVLPHIRHFLTKNPINLQ